MMIKYLRKSDRAECGEPASPVVTLDEEIDSLPFDRISCPDLKAIAEVWLELPRSEGEKLPRWSSFSPALVKQQLDKVCVIQVGNIDKDEIEFTVYGNHPTEMLGNGKPLRMEEIRANKARQQTYADICQRTGRSITNKAPQFARKSGIWEGEDQIEYEVILLPFEEENGTSRVLQPVCSWSSPVSSTA